MASINKIETSQDSRFQVTTTTTIRQSEGQAYLLKDPLDWEWQDIRDYVVSHTKGHYVSDPLKESAIFKSFLSRYPGGLGVLIAMAAFEVFDGMWANAPVTVTRFCKNSDAFFSDPILERVKGL